MTEYRTCTRCGVSLPADLSHFYACRKVASGLKSACKTCEKAYQAQHKADHPERFLDNGRRGSAKYRAKNPEKVQRALQDWRERNRQRTREYARDWAKRNPARRSYIQRVRYLKIAKTAEPFTQSAWDAKVKSYQGRCHWCTKKIDGTVQMDHLIPLSRGGIHALSNLVPSCATCNYSKHDKLPSEWKGRLL